MSRPARLERDAVEAWLVEHPAWSWVDGHLVRTLATVDDQSALAIVVAQAALATSLDHHAVVTLGYRSVRFELWTHDREAITSLDLDFAQGLDEIVVDRFEAFLV